MRTLRDSEEERSQGLVVGFVLFETRTYPGVALGFSSTQNAGRKQKLLAISSGFVHEWRGSLICTKRRGDEQMHSWLFGRQSYTKHF